MRPGGQRREGRGLRVAGEQVAGVGGGAHALLGAFSVFVSDSTLIHRPLSVQSVRLMLLRTRPAFSIRCPCCPAQRDGWRALFHAPERCRFGSRAAQDWVVGRTPGRRPGGGGSPFVSHSHVDVSPLPLLLSLNN